MQTELMMEQADLKKQVPADTIHDLNDKKISELTQEEAKSFREEWDVHFNDMLFRNGKFKVTSPGSYPRRFHDKSLAIDYLYSLTNNGILYECTIKRDKVLITRVV